MATYVTHQNNYANKKKVENLRPITTLGDGYNTFNRSAASAIVKLDKVHPAGVTSASNAYFCTTKEEVFKAIGARVDLSADSTWGSFSDKFEFVNNLNMNSTSIVIVVSATKITESQTLNAASLESTYGSALSLYNKGGDSYVSYIVKGGQYMAAYSFVSYDNETYTNLVNSASANFKVGGSTFQANFNTSIENISKVSKVTYQFQQKAIGFSSSDFPAPEKFIDFVLHFNTNIVLNGPVVMDFSTDSYSRIIEDGIDFSQIDTYRTAYINSRHPDKGYSALDLLAKSHKSLIQNVADIYDYYGCLGADPRLTTVPEKLTEDSDKISDWLDLVSENPTKEGIPSPVLSGKDGIKAGLPTIKFYLLKYGVSPKEEKNKNMKYFSDVGEKDILNRVLPEKITVFAGDILDSIETGYKYADGTYRSERHGGGGGDPTPPMQMTQGDYVNKVVVWYSDYVDGVQIVTNHQNLVVPQSPGGGYIVAWDSSTTNNCCFVGWSGTEGRYIDSLRALYVQFDLASWKNPRSIE